jgi:hypothetical protein
MTICPCCGFKFVGALSNGCPDCGARSVGEALPRPAHELPSYGRALVLTVSGSLVVLVFLTQLFIAMFQRGFKSLGFWTWVAAGETAAWRLKWISIPVMMLVLWLGLKLYRSIKNQPDRFCGLTYARRGLLASATVGLLIATLIGVTVPARLRQREMALDAGKAVNYQTYALALYRYQIAYKTLPDPVNLKEQLAKLPDPDGSIAAVLRDLDTAGYQPRADIAAVGKPKSAKMGGMAIRNIGFNAETDDATPPGLAFTNYEHRFAGADKILGNEDDWIVRDGVVSKVTEMANVPARTNSVSNP